MSDLISRQAAIHAIMGQPPEPHYPSWYAEQIKELPSAEPDARIIELRTVDALIQAAYKAGKEGRPLMVALNEEVTT